MVTVRQLARLAGITPRTLHYYDQIGLLKPSEVGENGYRYYSEAALLRLQQILFYRALDMPLSEIRALLDDPAFDPLQALEAHKAELLKRKQALEKLVRTVDHTILHLKGIIAMETKDLFAGFSPEVQAAYEKEAMEIYDPEIVKASIQKWNNTSAPEKKALGVEGQAVYDELLRAIPRGPGSPEAQAGVERWRKHIENFWTPDDAALLGLAQGYNNDPRFKATFDKIHPELAAFILAAVEHYLDSRRKAA